MTTNPNTKVRSLGASPGEARSAWDRYGLAALLVGLAVALTLTLQPALQGSRDIFFILAIILGAWYGGWGPGLLAAVLSTLGLNFIFVEPLFSLQRPTAAEVLWLATFLVVAVLSAGVASAYRRQIRQSNAERDRLLEAAEAARLAAERAAERAERLQAVAAAVSHALTPEEVAGVFVAQGVAAVHAQAGLMMQVAPGGQHLELLQSHGYPVEYTGKVARLPLDAQRPIPTAAREGRPLWLPTQAAVLSQFPALAAVGRPQHLEGLAVLPLIFEQRVLGVGVVSFDAPHAFSEDDRRMMLALAGLCAQALERARLFVALRQAWTEAEAARRDLGFLAGASVALAGSLDFYATLQTVVGQAVGYLAEWCGIDLLDESGGLTQAAAAHNQEALQPVMHELRRQFPPDPQQPPWQTALAGQTVLLAHLTPEMLAARVVGPEHQALLERLGAASQLIVPIRLRRQVAGMLSLMRGGQMRPYSEADVPLAEGLAARAGMALENASLVVELRATNLQLESRVRERTEALQTTVEQLRVTNAALEAEVAARRRSEDRFRRMLEAAPDPTVIVDEAGRVVLANAQVERVFGYAPADLAGQPVETLLPQRLAAQHRLHRARYNRNPSARPMGEGLELLARHREGHEFPVEVALGPLQTEEGGLVSCVIRDISARRAAQQALQVSHEQLRALMMRVNAVREEERARIAREVHDELGGALTGLKMDMTRLRRSLDAGDVPEAVARIQVALHSIDETVGQVRRIAQDLRPAILDDFGLAAAIEWQLREFEQRSGLACVLEDETQDVVLPMEKATAVFRVFQETLTNIARHAQATRVCVRLQQRERRLLLEVSDNGRGITPEEIGGARSLGLVGMRERVRLLNGALDIYGTPGQGTTVLVAVPLLE